MVRALKHDISNSLWEHLRKRIFWVSVYSHIKHGRTKNSLKNLHSKKVIRQLSLFLIGRLHSISFLSAYNFPQPTNLALVNGAVQCKSFNCVYGHYSPIIYVDHKIHPKYFRFSRTDVLIQLIITKLRKKYQLSTFMFSGVIFGADYKNLVSFLTGRNYYKWFLIFFTSVQNHR